MDEIDEYRCPVCGHSNEVCRCDDDTEYDFDYDDYYIDPDPFFPDDDDLEEVVCYLDGKPLTRYDIQSMNIAG